MEFTHESFLVQSSTCIPGCQAASASCGCGSYFVNLNTGLNNAVAITAGANPTSGQPDIIYVALSTTNYPTIAQLVSTTSVASGAYTQANFVITDPAVQSFTAVDVGVDANGLVWVTTAAIGGGDPGPLYYIDPVRAYHLQPIKDDINHHL